jgi:two-component system chemotaxis sensor kinase CheA
MARDAEDNARALARRVDHLIADVKDVLMLPVASILGGLPKVVRELARELGKEVDLQTRGVDLQVDKRLLDELGAPLLHLVRNALDHGAEPPAERERAGKARRATLTLAVEQTSPTRMRLTLADDGRGIDPERVRAAAIDKGVLAPEVAAELSAEELQALVFESALTTRASVSELSGRGLGLAIVGEQIEQLGGSVALDSEPGRGTAFHLDLPLTRSTTRGLLVRIGDERFIVPTPFVQRVVRVAPDAIGTVHGKDTVTVDGVATAWVSLAAILEVPAGERGAQDDDKLPALLLALGDDRFALAVDEVLDEQEIAVRSLGPQLVRVRNVAGATILGSGEVVALLSVGDIVRSVGRVAALASTRSASHTPQARRAILVAEDSVTSRTLLKTILEAAGYRVQTAVDGDQAWTLLRGGGFDALVSDVEMPHINGFELTSLARKDPRFCELPIVLVTALDSEQERRRGLEAGASAYIVKRSFDDASLLDALGRLL